MWVVCGARVTDANNSLHHRSSFEVLVANIKNQESLSLLLSALAKLWHMVQVSKDPRTCTRHTGSAPPVPIVLAQVAVNCATAAKVGV